MTTANELTKWMKQVDSNHHDAIIAHNWIFPDKKKKPETLITDTNLSSLNHYMHTVKKHSHPIFSSKHKKAGFLFPPKQTEKREYKHCPVLIGHFKSPTGRTKNYKIIVNLDTKTRKVYANTKPK